MAILKITVKKVRTASVQQLAMQYTKYIVDTHCTLAEAAKHFGVPRSTLWWRLEQLPYYDRKATKKVAVENMRKVVEIMNRKRLEKYDSSN